MNKITLFDPSVCSANSADNYLMETCYQILSDLLPNSFFYKVSTHNCIDVYAQDRINNSELGIICGSGIISAQPPSIGSHTQWRVDPTQIEIPVTGLGIGVERTINRFSDEADMFYYRIFHSQTVAARGATSVDALAMIGVEAVNTSCPTLWDTDFSCVPNAHGKNVIFATNVYRRMPELAVLSTLRLLYENVYIYCQHPSDYDIFKDADFKYAPCNLPALAKFAQDNDCDYVGARLHAAAFLAKHGIRCLPYAVDARITEVWGGVDLPVAYKPEDIIEFYSMGRMPIANIPYRNIDTWKRWLQNEYC